MSAPVATNMPAPPTSNTEPAIQTTTSGMSTGRIIAIIAGILVLMLIIFFAVRAMRKPSTANVAAPLNTTLPKNMGNGSTLNARPNAGGVRI